MPAIIFSCLPLLVCNPNHKSTCAMSLDPTATIRIDITGSIRSGKSIVTAVIADALKEAFAGAEVEVHSGDGDYPLQAQRLHDGDIKRMRAMRLVVRDVNDVYVDPKPAAEAHYHAFQIAVVAEEESA